jgi:hypothetical protein
MMEDLRKALPAKTGRVVLKPELGLLDLFREKIFQLAETHGADSREVKVVWEAYNRQFRLMYPEQWRELEEMVMSDIRSRGKPKQ